MDFIDCFNSHKSFLMEGALGERLKREYNLAFDDNIVMAGLVYFEAGRRALLALWSEYADIASAYGLPFLATTPTRRVNKERIERSKYDASVIRSNVEFLRLVQKQQKAQMYVGGMLGCKGDAYTGQGAPDANTSEAFHEWEIELFAESKVDFLYAALMPDVREAAGVARAIAKYRIPYIVSFTIQRDGCLVDGTTISDAIQAIDQSTDDRPVCYMANCVHPRIVNEALARPFNRNETVGKRFLGVQANTSPLPYDELDHAADLKTSDPVALAKEMVMLRERIPMKIFGGCCGTDGGHMREIARRI